MADIKLQRRQLVRESLDQIVARVNQYLSGRKLRTIEPILARLGRGAKLPHWYPELLKNGNLPNLDGKTVGSIIEMLIVADIERNVLSGNAAKELTINPAKGVDIPDLELSIKSPSENWCTSEPFSNAYERLLGPEYDVVAVITNYQRAKKKRPLKLQLIEQHYFQGHQMGDKDLCSRAKKIRSSILQHGDVQARKVFRFLAFAVRSEWLCSALLELVTSLDQPSRLPEILKGSIAKFDRDTKKRKTQLPPEEKQILENLCGGPRLDQTVVGAADDWTMGKWPEAARLPNDNEWNRLQKSPLDGQLGVSFALQWRFNFGVFFRGAKEKDD